MAITSTASLNLPTAPSWWTGVRLLKERRTSALIGSNTLTAVGGGMQMLLHGWLAVSWGHSPFFLGIYAVARLAPKILLTVPAGIVCDRFPRARILLAARAGYAIASLLPLVGLVAPAPMAWLLAAAVLAGAIHAFDLSSARCVMGDMIDPEDMHAAVALNRVGSHIASLAGPAVAFVLISGPGTVAALSVSAALLLGASLAVLPLRSIVPAACDGRLNAATGGFFRYLRSSPITLILVLAGVAPAFIDKSVALLLPSVSGGGGGTVSMALIAPEVGALVAMCALAVAPVRLGSNALIAAAVLYALFISVASMNSHEAEALVITLGLAGMASAALSATTHARLQRTVPSEMRGRVFAM